ncbi:MAG: IPT/TIG domain-containing protein [Candidatus Sericytochromatia bacterium]|uniref:IPT/TIG domain-containing protein n=1 Tax=Candidatus Tanganyikabacteria bacterium TaxID=2961651 RepID=A0A938BPC5_9BACT|nr:IPT/TIG domain-containing protein [Candidatus Tanganyikabacteria bacterium]
MGKIHSNPLQFRVVRTLVAGVDRVTLPPLTVFGFGKLVEARDSEGLPIAEIRDGDKILKYGPNLDWSVDSALGVVTQAGSFTGSGDGNVTLAIRAGAALVQTMSIALQAGAAVPDITPNFGGTSNPGAGSAPPGIASVTPANGAAGARITLKGTNFGTGTAPLAVFFGALIGLDPVRLANGSVQVTVPSGAVNGDIAVTVGEKSSNGVPFRVLKALTLATSSIEILAGKRVAAPIGALDSAGVTLSDPALTWDAAGSGLVVDSSNGITAIEVGDYSLKAVSGDLSKVLAVRVFKILKVKLAKADFLLNARPETGDPDPGFQTGAQAVATVEATDGTGRRVTWSTSDASLVSIDAAGNMLAGRLAREGVAIVTATAVDDPAISATASVRILHDSLLDLEIK